MTRILAVCLGNICRSPTAEAVIRKRAEEAGVPVTVDSAGTGDWHTGDPPHPPMIRSAAARGYDLAPLRARQVEIADFDRFDLILAMDRSNLANVERLRPRGSNTPVRLMLDYAPDAETDEVPDPYYTGGYDEALDLIEAATDGLLAQLQSDRAKSPKA